MVAKITVPKSILSVLNYNEKKVKEDKAACLLASGFLKETASLDFREKRDRLEGRISLNKRAVTNTVHISLNFAEGEKLPKETLQQIASLYMEKIGFSDQPYLVYEHFDAGHPHLHIVTTNIQRDGRRITLHHLGKGASEQARKELELKFGLVRAGGKKKVTLEAVPMLATKAVYGKSSTRQAITNVLQVVLPHYRYTSLPELNAILQLYNVRTDSGSENSFMYRHGGLMYQLLDEQGKKVGVPLKASNLNGKPTLPYLEQKFNQNAVHKIAYRKGLQSIIDWVLIKIPPSLAAFEKAIQKENISLVVRQNEAGIIYGLTYIDHRTKCVFNGSDLGKAYSAKGILEKCGITTSQREGKGMLMKPAQERSAALPLSTRRVWNEEAALALLAQLLQVEPRVENIPFEFKKQKKKRRKF